MEAEPPADQMVFAFQRWDQQVGFARRQVANPRAAGILRARCRSRADDVHGLVRPWMVLRGLCDNESRERRGRVSAAGARVPVDQNSGEKCSCTAESDDPSRADRWRGGTGRPRGPRRTAATPPAMPSAPVSFNVIDVAGQLQLTQGGDGGLRQGPPQAGVEDLLLGGAGARAARQAEGPAGRRPGGHRPGADRQRRALSAGVDQKLWIPIVTDYAAVLPNRQDIYLPGALKMQALAQNQGYCVCSARAARSSNTCPMP